MVSDGEFIVETEKILQVGLYEVLDVTVWFVSSSQTCLATTPHGYTAWRKSVMIVSV